MQHAGCAAGAQCTLQNRACANLPLTSVLQSEEKNNTQEVATQEMLGVTQNTHSPKFNTCAQTHPGCTRCRCTEPWCPPQSPCCAPTPCLICPADHVNSRVEEGAMTSTGGGHDAAATARSESLRSIGFKNKPKKTLHSCKPRNQIWKTHRCTLKKHSDIEFFSITALDTSFVTVCLQYFTMIFALMSLPVALFEKQVCIFRHTHTCRVFFFFLEYWPSSLLSLCSYRRAAYCRLALSPFEK